MNDSNPYVAPLKSAQIAPSRGKKFEHALMGAGLMLLGIAAYLFIFSERFTFYTPYSSTTNWILSLPNGMDYSIDALAGFSATLACFLAGSILVSISTVIKLRATPNQKNVDAP